MEKYILIYINYAAPYEGNFIASQKALEKEMNQKNIGFIYMIPQTGEKYDWTHQLKNQNNKIFFMPKNSFKNINLLTKIFEKHNILFVHSHFISRKQLFEFKLSNLLSRKNLPIVEHFHNHYVYRDNPIKQAIKHILMKGDYIIACGSSVKRSLLEGKLTNHITCIDNAIDLKRLDGANLRKDNAFNLLMFGFDYERKGVDLAVEACKSLIKKYPDLRLNICLSINKDYVENRIRNLCGEFPEWITLLPPTNSISDYYANTYAFISPSREEGLCYSLIEAAYCKCPVIASEISGQVELDIPEIIWCKPMNQDDLAKKICCVIEMPYEEKLKLGEKLKSSAIRNYTLDRWVMQIIDYYEKMKLVYSK